MVIPWVVAGGVLVLVLRWVYVYQQGKMDDAAFEYRIRNRQDLK